LGFNWQRGQRIFPLNSSVGSHSLRGPMLQPTLSRQPAHILRVPAGKTNHVLETQPIVMHGRTKLRVKVMRSPHSDRCTKGTDECAYTYYMHKQL
jgi:hypothetical protein